MGRDRLAQKIVLITSLAVIVLLVVAALKENVFNAWRYHQWRYRHILKTAATDQHGQSIVESYRMGPQQVVVPALDVVDRCVTCHRGIDDPRMVDQKNPYKTHPQDILANHPVDQFGCTICHQGQGRAMTFPEAKAEDVHWDFPLLPTAFTQGTCGVCHDPAALRAEAPRLAQGRDLFLDKGCQSCHKLEGIGGNLGVALDGVGSKPRAAFPFAHVKGTHTVATWLMEHFHDPQRVVMGSKMKNPQLTDKEAEALTIYMLSLQDRDLPRAFLPPDRIEAEYRQLHRAPLSGQVLYQRYCLSCHGEGLSAHYDPILQRYVPAVRNPSFLAVATDEFIRQSIEDGRPGRDMPSWTADAGGLLPEEIDNLVTFIRGDHALGPAYDSTYVADGDVARGAELFKRNCVGCHGVGGIGKYAPSLANAAFQRAATDGYLRATVIGGRHGTGMPSFLEGSRQFAHLDENDVKDLVSYVRSLGTQEGP